MPKPVLKKSEKEALLMVRKMLAGGVISHLPRRYGFIIGGSRPVSQQFLKPLFNMASVTVEAKCGTAHCIGGWMGTLLNDEIMQIMDDPRFDKLFYPNVSEAGDKRKKFGKRSWDSITPREAVRAIDSFLKTGNPNWSRQINPNG